MNTADLYTAPSFTAVERRKADKLLKLITAEPPVLDVGPANPVGDYLAAKMGAGELLHTVGDLNYIGRWNDRHYNYPNTVWCFDVLEHLMNPLQFMEWLRESVGVGVRYYFTFPNRPRPFWGPHHFHEYDPKRFAVLCEAAGFTIVRHERFVVRWPLRAHLRGLRSLLRILPPAWCREEFYELEAKI